MQDSYFLILVLSAKSLQPQVSDKTVITVTFCLLSFLFHSAWMETQLNQSPPAHRGVLACEEALQEKEATRQTGRAKVRGRSGPSILGSAVALQGPVSRHLSQGWGGQARRQAPLTACYRHMLLEHVHAQTGMA